MSEWKRATHVALAAAVCGWGSLAWGQAGQPAPGDTPRAKPLRRTPASSPSQAKPPTLKFPLEADAVVAELDQRHVNAISGYSFCPPVKTQRLREYTSASRVSWIRIQEKTGALIWALSVYQNQVAVDKENVDPNVLAKVLAGRLRQQERFDVEKHELGKVGHLRAIHFRGRTGIDWERQTWVVTQPGNFLVFRIAGPAELDKRLDGLLDKCLETLRLIDVKEVRQNRRNDLAAGAGALGPVTADKLAAAIRPEAQWYLLTYQGKNAGFMRVVESARPLSGVEGYAVRAWTMVEVPKLPVRLLRREMFVSQDRKVERWLDQWQTGGDKKAENGAETGLVQDDRLVCEVDPGGGQKMQVHEYDLRDKADYYLPRALGMLLPRLVDLGKPAGYAFVTYNGAKNAFEIRSFAVVGPASVMMGDAQVQAVKVTDRSSDDVEPATVYLSPAGDLLRMESPDGLVMELSSAAAVRKAYPKADAIVKALGL